MFVPERLCISVHVQLLLMCELTVEIGRVSMSILFLKKKKKGTGVRGLLSLFLKSPSDLMG